MNEPEAPVDDAPSLAALEGRLRRRRLKLERMNPLDDFQAYRERLEEVAALEARRREWASSEEA